jgi:copper homeostasis protein
MTTQDDGTVALEISISSPAGSRAALAGGADRVELCVGLELGGLTPSQGLIEAVVAESLPVHVLIRCRPGDFVFDEDEIKLMGREVRAALLSGAAGVVIGALNKFGSIDESAIARWVATAKATHKEATVTFNRAIDQASDPAAAMARLAGLGIDRVLTSGGAARALDGTHTLKAMVAASGDVQVMAGGGVAPSDVPALVALGVDAVHLSAKCPVGRQGGSWVSLGTATTSGQKDSHFVTDTDVVAATRESIQLATVIHRPLVAVKHY